MRPRLSHAILAAPKERVAPSDVLEAIVRDVRRPARRAEATPR